MESTSEKNNSKLIITILSVLLAALAIFTIYNIKNTGNKVDDLTETKAKIQSELDAKIAELDLAMTSNNEMDAQLNETKNQLIILRDSVMNLKYIDKQIINKLNLRISELEKTKVKLLKDVDSLKVANQQLGIEIDSANVNIQRQATTIQTKIVENEQLTTNNTQLTEKVTKGAALKVSSVKAVALKERSSGKLRDTEYAGKTDAFRLSFLIRENAIADEGLRKAYIVIQDTTGKVIGSKGTFSDVNGQEIEYSDSTEVNYLNNDLEVIVITDVAQNSLKKGDYYIKVYLESNHLGTTKVTLK
jgi:hypothetical protein